MLPKFFLMANLAIMFITFHLTASLNANAFVAPNQQHITDPKMNYSIKGDNVILHSLIGDIKIPMPDYAKRELEEMNLKKVQSKRARRQIWPTQNMRNIDPFYFADFFECNEQAQIALSAYSDNHRYWEAFFKRNSINDTIAVRYCCNLLEYIDNAEMSLSQECRDQVRLQDHVMIKPQIRYVCRQYEFYNVQCFLVRWMYWWIPLLLIILIALGIFFGCSAVRRRSNKSQLHEDVKSLKEAKSYDDNSNTLPYRPAYTSSPLRPVTNKAFMHH